MRHLDFWFDFASPYSFVTAMRVEPLCRAAQVSLTWKPFLLGPLFSAQQNLKTSPFEAFPVRGQYMVRDVTRLSEKYGIGAFALPTPFPPRSLLAARLACVVMERPRFSEFVRAVFDAEFLRGKDIASPEVLGELLTATGFDAAASLADAETEPVKRRLRTLTEEASTRGFFGAPNLVANGHELFFGQDRLDDAVAWASGKGTS